MDGKELMQGTPHFRVPLLSKTEQLISTIHKSLNKALVVAGIFIGSALPVAVTLGTAAAALVACSTDSSGIDTTPPTITLNHTEAEVTGGKVVRISGNQLFVGDALVASWKDNASKDCTIALSFNGNTITSGTTLNKKGVLSISVTDESGNTQKSSLTINAVNNAPEICVHKEEVDIDEGKEITVDGNQLLIGDEVVASWEDDVTENCSFSLKYNDEAIKSGDIIKKAGTLSITVSDEEGLSSSATITLFINNGRPEITILQPEVDVSKGKTITRKGDQLLLGTEAIVSWTDDKTTNCTLTLKMDEEEVKPGASLRYAGTLEITVTDKEGKSSSVNIKLTITNAAPVITVKKNKVNVYGGMKVTLSDHQLQLGSAEVASWTDDRTKNCKTSLKLNGAEITSGTTINDAGKLELTVTDEDGEISKKEITLTNESIYGLENLRNLSIQVDQEVDIMKGITFADGIQLQQVTIEMNGKTTVLTAPYHFTATNPGKCTIIITMKGPNGKVFEEKVSKTIAPLEYKSISISHLKPSDILPIVGQIDRGDTEAYKHIEHLRIAEATRIRDMMWQYGAGSHSPEEYQQLMSRLHTGMTAENPKGYSNYEIIGEKLDDEPKAHGHNCRDILNTIISHATFQLHDNKSRNEFPELLDVISQNQNNIYIFGCSTYGLSKSNETLTKILNQYPNLYQAPNFIFRVAGANIDTQNGVVMNKILQNESNPTNSGEYGKPSMANGKNDSNVDRHIMVTIGTNTTGNLDLTNQTLGSKFPVGFHKDVLFAGRSFPHKEIPRGNINAEAAPYQTSYTNYVNVAMTDLCFQMFAEVKNVDKLLQMIRNTSLTDHISLDGQTQALQLINPAGFFQKYLMPTKLPTSAKSSTTTSLDKGYYKGVIFDIPGAEVKVNGKWITYSEANKAQIKAQNPFKLEWRLNGDLCKKMGYGAGKTLKGKVIVVDDKWNGLNITKEFSVNMSS